MAVRQHLVPPDPFRLRYRSALMEVIKDIVLNSKSPSKEAIMAVIPKTVTKRDRSRFLELVLKEFEILYEGNANRFGLKALEVDGWKKAIK